MTLTSTAGDVTIDDAPYVQRMDGSWFSLLRESWGLETYQTLTPELLNHICLTAAATFSYERASEVLAAWNSPITDDSTIHRHVQKAGLRAREDEKRRVKESQIPASRERIINEAKVDNDFSLLIMLDGWMARERGPEWGLKPAESEAERVAWKEMKTAIVLRVEDRAQSASGRPMIIDKAIVAHQGEWDELAKKLYAEALRRGLEQAKEVFVVADGGLWIWNLQKERFPNATGVLDFYHASQHLWEAARTLYPDDNETARRWVEPLLHQLRHGGEAGVIQSLADLKEVYAEMEEERAAVLRRTTEYFAEHEERVHYEEVSKKGCPVGSGAMESTCAQLQGRLKRTGQFWTKEGKANLLSLELARRNGDWPRIWSFFAEQT